MVKTLLFNESPYIGYTLLLSGIISYLLGYHLVSLVFFILVSMLMVFYRYYEYNTRHADYEIISPANGKITFLKYDLEKNKYYVSIYLSPFNIHTQIYPANGTVYERYYDTNGRFELATNLDKSKDNEKKIHKMVLNNGGSLIVTQIAGFLPRRIASSDIVPEKVMAGDYLGIIKFGSRVDMEFDINTNDGKKLQLLCNIGDTLNIGDLIAEYK